LSEGRRETEYPHLSSESEAGKDFRCGPVFILSGKVLMIILKKKTQELSADQQKFFTIWLRN
jgi:hypothetical protein